jgi:hypothetical protein
MAGQSGEGREGKQEVAFLKKSSAKDFYKLYTRFLNVPGSA